MARVLDLVDPWGSPWGKPGESLGKESRLQDFEKNFLSLCVSYSSGRTFF